MVGNKKNNKQIFPYQESLMQEKYAEHVFLKDLLFSAQKQGYRLSIAHPEVDIFGYDLIVERYKGEEIKENIKIQLKSISGKNTRVWPIHISHLKNNGKVIIIDLRYESPKYFILENSKREYVMNNPYKSQLNRCKLGKTDCKELDKEFLMQIFSNE